MSLFGVERQEGNEHQHFGYRRALGTETLGNMIEAALSGKLASGENQVKQETRGVQRRGSRVEGKARMGFRAKRPLRVRSQQQSLSGATGERGWKEPCVAVTSMEVSIGRVLWPWVRLEKGQFSRDSTKSSEILYLFRSLPILQYLYLISFTSSDPHTAIHSYVFRKVSSCLRVVPVSPQTF